MTTTLDAVISFVRDEVNRGDSADNVIPVKIMQAIQFIERNTNWKYMQKIFEFDLFTNASLEAPYILVDNLKEIEFVRIVDVSLEGVANYCYLEEYYSPKDQKTIKIGNPDKFYRQGSGHVWFNAIPSEALDMHVGFYQFTGTLQIDQSCWLFDNALDVIIAKTMQLMAPWLRQPMLVGAYEPMLQTGMKTLFKANEDAKLTASAKIGDSNG